MKPDRTSVGSKAEEIEVDAKSSYVRAKVRVEPSSGRVRLLVRHKGTVLDLWLEAGEARRIATHMLDVASEVAGDDDPRGGVAL